MLVPPATRCGGRGPSAPSRVLAGQRPLPGGCHAAVTYSSSSGSLITAGSRSSSASPQLSSSSSSSLLLGSRGGTAVLAKLCQVEMFTELRGAMSTLVGCHGFTEAYYYECTAKGDLGVPAAPQSLAGAIAMPVPRRGIAANLYLGALKADAARAQLTAFTVTLSLTALQIVVIPSAIVEPACGLQGLAVQLGQGDPNAFAPAAANENVPGDRIR